ncbi:MAG: ATP-binding protein [Mariniphaga sp.]|nr:ATP-binding protein [Mariniphaga sp.]
MINLKLLIFLKKVILYRMELEFNGKKTEYPYYDKEDSDDFPLTGFIKQHKLTEPEIIILLIAFVPNISSIFFTSIIHDYLPNGGDFPEFGGVKAKNHRGMIPTGETALYILAGNDVEKRLKIAKLFSEDHLFAKKGVLYLDSVPTGEPKMSGRLVLDEEYVDLFTTGKISAPKMNSEFPAQLLNTGLEWKDLVLCSKTMEEVGELETWLKYNDTLLNEWQMKDKIKPGYKILFYGPPGTGKTFTATLLGKRTGRDVYRIDLSLVVSKYIGETEKNLSKLFDKAQNKDWILFFDEADAIFGKRTNVRDAHDKYANQEVSYLLQRIESHPGLVILASNFKSNIDYAFTRRFNSIVEFKNPNEKERELLWKKYRPSEKSVKHGVIEGLARKFEITGANIVNVIHFACLKTIERKANEVKTKEDEIVEDNSIEIYTKDLLEGIKKEYEKEGKLISNLKNSDL